VSSQRSRTSEKSTHAEIIPISLVSAQGILNIKQAPNESIQQDEKAIDRFKTVSELD
jgi:hypothetical protein